MPGFRARPIMFSIRPTHCVATAIYPRSIRGRQNGSAAPIPVRHGHVAARSKRTRRNVALYSCARRHVRFDRVYFIAGGRVFDTGQRMLELWNNWYDALASAEALATVIV